MCLPPSVSSPLQLRINASAVVNLNVPSTARPATPGSHNDRSVTSWAATPRPLFKGSFVGWHWILPLEESPTDTVDRRAAGLITDEEMMNKLLHRNYGFGAAVRIDGVVTDAYARGTWDDIEMAYYQRLLTDDESHTLADYP